MNPAALAVGAVALLALAGCSAPGSSDAPAPIQAAFVTPGIWDVRSETDHMMAWVHNLQPTPASVTLRLTGPGGAPLPEGWNVTISPSQFELAADSTKRSGAGGFPSWGVAVLTLKLPPGTTAGSQAVELHAGGFVHEAKVDIRSERVRVAAIGDTVTVDTVGTFQDDGSTFWTGEFETALGPRGRAVTGVGWGLVGTAQGETVPLVVPPALAYGYDNPPGSGFEQFNGRTLVFTMTAKRIAAGP